MHTDLRHTDLKVMVQTSRRLIIDQSYPWHSTKFTGCSKKGSRCIKQMKNVRYRKENSDPSPVPSTDLPFIAVLAMVMEYRFFWPPIIDVEQSSYAGSYCESAGRRIYRHIPRHGWITFFFSIIEVFNRYGISPVKDIQELSDRFPDAHWSTSVKLLCHYTSTDNEDDRYTEMERLLGCEPMSFGSNNISQFG